MIEEAARSANDHSHTFPKSGLLLTGVLAAHDGARHHVVEELQELFDLELNLNAKFSGRR